MTPRPATLEDKVFLLLVLAVSLAMAWLLEALFGAILWGLIATILFAPLNRRILARWPGKRNLAAAATLLLIVAVVIVPAILLASAVVDQLSAIYAQIRSGQIDLDLHFHKFQAALPDWAGRIFARLGLTDLAGVREQITAGFTQSFQSIAQQVLNIGQGAFSLVVSLGVMLYLTFFLLRDEAILQRQIETAVPIRTHQWRALVERFVAVVRATMKGSIVVGIVQGAIGGLVFAALGIHAPLLWGVLMAFLSLLPAVGTGLVWVPVAAYLLISGAVVKGLILIFCGLFVIGLVDNLLRPILVGREARMPDYIVLISTLGGIEVFGFSGFVIGPVIAAMFMAVWTIFAETRRRHETPLDLQD
jgi:predicted PurR-regulated permease PerM